MIVINLDVMMAKRKISLGELSERVGISLANLSILKNNHAKAIRFSTLDAVSGTLNKKFDYIYSVAVIHMLVEDEDRKAFYSFIKEHLTENGIALICSMGDGKIERKTDVRVAFDLGERVCEGETVLVAETSCRIVTFQTFENELKETGFEIMEQGFTSVENHFPVMMYAVVKR